MALRSIQARFANVADLAFPISRLHWAARMTGGVNQATVFNNRLTAQAMRNGVVIVFGFRWIYLLITDPTSPVCSLIDFSLLILVEKPLRIYSKTDGADDRGAPLVVVFRDRRAGRRLSSCDSIPICQDV